MIKMKTLKKHINESLFTKHITPHDDNLYRYRNSYHTDITGNIYLRINTLDEYNRAIKCANYKEYFTPDIVEDACKTHDKIVLLQIYKSFTGGIGVSYVAWPEDHFKDMCEPFGYCDIDTEFNYDYWHKNKWC